MMRFELHSTENDDKVLLVEGGGVDHDANTRREERTVLVQIRDDKNKTLSSIFVSRSDFLRMSQVI